jgi:hypothetical protein
MAMKHMNLRLPIADCCRAAVVLCAVALARMAFAEIGSTSTPPFAWDYSNSLSIARYEVHYGPLGRTTNDPFYARNYTATNSVIRLATSAVLTGLNPGIWFVSVTAIGTNGVPSLYSNEVCYTNRGEAPVNLRILGPTEMLLIESTWGPADQWTTVVEFTNTPAQRALRFSELFRARRVAPPPPAPGGQP